MILLLCTLTFVDDFKEFTPKDASFVVLFPGEPTQRGSLNVGGVTWQLAAKDRLYQVTRTPVPGGEAPSPRQIQTALNEVRDNLAKRIQAKLIAETTLRHRGIPAREYLFELPEGKGRLRARAFVVKGHVWEIKVGGPKEYLEGKDAEKYLGSLEIK
jgi:hypothetical protein